MGLCHTRSAATISPSSSVGSNLEHRPLRRWAVNGAILASHPYYYLDPAEQIETKRCLNAMMNGQIVLLAGARSSGKTTRLLRLRELLEEMGYQVI